MAADPRQRSSRQHATAPETQVIDFAGPKLQQAFSYGPYPLLLHGAYNSAKTVTFCLKMLFVADLFPGYRWAVGRKIWDELRKTTMSSFFKFCPRAAWEPHGRRSDTEKILELNNGSSFIWMHLDDPDTLTLVRGLEINGFLLDQVEELYEEIFTALLPRLGRWDRVTVPDAIVQQHIAATNSPWPWVHPETKKLMPPSYALLTANPDHELHWMYPRFDDEDPAHHEKRILIEHDRPTCPNVHENLAGACECGRLLFTGKMARPGERVSYHDLGYKMIGLSAYDNKYATRQSLQEMEAQDETWKSRFLWGKKGITEGQIHQVRPESILEPSEGVLNHILYHCTLHRAMDHGDSAATCVLWFAVDADGNVFFFREYYMPNKLISEHRQNVYGLSRHESYKLQLADPAIFSPSMQKNNQRWSVAQEYADCANYPRETAIFWQKGDNDEFGTRNRISEYLRPSGFWQMENGEPREVPRIHPITKERGLWPRLFFVKRTTDYPNGCDQLLRQLKSQRREKIGTDNGKPIFADDRDMKIPDHAYDPLRYAMASQPPIPHGVPAKYSAKSFYGWRDSLDKTKKRSKMLAKMGKQYASRHLSK